MFIKRTIKNVIKKEKKYKQEFTIKEISYFNNITDIPMIITKEEPYNLKYNKRIRRILKKSSSTNNLLLRDLYQNKYERIKILVLHEIGHIRHEQLLKYISEEKIIEKLVGVSLYSKYHKDGWKDIFSDLYALYRYDKKMLKAHDIEVIENLLEYL